MRIYTCLGKENIRTVESFAIHREQFNIESDATYIELIDNEDTVTAIKHIIKTGQPCNVHIRFEDDDTEAECTLDCCTVCDQTNRILCPDPKIQLIRQRQNNEL